MKTESKTPAHTPGPWRTDATGAEAPDGTIVMNALGLSICDCAAGNPQMTPAEAEANARLVAAAPDLLAACIEARRVYDTMVLVFGDVTFAPFPGHPDARPGSLKTMLDAAIAKATRGTQ